MSHLKQSSLCVAGIQGINDTEILIVGRRSKETKQLAYPAR